MPPPDPSPHLLQSPSVQSALLITGIGTLAAILGFFILPRTAARQSRERLLGQGLAPILRNGTGWSVPVPPERLRQALLQNLDERVQSAPTAPNDPTALVLHGCPAAHWNLNRLQPVAFDQAIVTLGPDGPGSSTVVWSCRHAGAWRAVLVLVLAVGAMAFLLQRTEPAGPSARTITGILIAFAIPFLALRHHAQHQASRTWFEGWLLQAARMATLPADPGSRPSP